MSDCGSQLGSSTPSILQVTDSQEYGQEMVQTHTRTLGNGVTGSRAGVSTFFVLGAKVVGRTTIR